MVAVEFHILTQAGSEARLRQVCQLTEQAQQRDERVFIRVDDSQLTQLDELLWTFADYAFIPHERITDQPPHPRVIAILGGDQALPPRFTTVINLCDSIPPQLQASMQVHEVIDATEATKQQGRQRYKRYRELGCPLQTTNY